MVALQRAVYTQFVSSHTFGPGILALPLNSCIKYLNLQWKVNDMLVSVSRALIYFAGSADQETVTPHGARVIE